MTINVVMHHDFAHICVAQRYRELSEADIRSVRSRCSGRRAIVGCHHSGNYQTGYA
jgi:hypothetical protein